MPANVVSIAITEDQVSVKNGITSTGQGSDGVIGIHNIISATSDGHGRAVS
jgi:hypothetical protein